MGKRRRAKTSRGLHKWLGLVFSLFFILWAVSGIVLNHRSFFSGWDVDRNVIPSDYSYENWNLAAVKGVEKISTDSSLIFGNIGVWLTNNYRNFADYNKGFPGGIDNRKISAVLKSKSGRLYAGTYFGLFEYNHADKAWIKIQLPEAEERIVDIREKADTLVVMTRSFLWFGLVNNSAHDWHKISLPPPEVYNNKVGLFRTLWVIHSGEIYGLPGKLIIDFTGLVFIFLSLTGLVYFFMPGLLKRRKRKGKSVKKHGRFNRWSLKWHNKIGIWLVAILIINTAAGMFLRPPLLIAIANAKVAKIKYSYLDNPNPWFDKLRGIIYDDSLARWIVGTNEGIYYSDDDFQSELKAFDVQPPLSVMGINVFKQLGKGEYLVGSFSGLFRWIPSMHYVENYVTKNTRINYNPSGPPIGQEVVTGYLEDSAGREYFFDYGRGAVPINSMKAFTPMPDKIRNLPMSLWNVMLEVHTARFFKFLFGDFYILFIPLFGIFSLTILITGLVVWLKVYWQRKRRG